MQIRWADEVCGVNVVKIVVKICKLDEQMKCVV